MKLRPEHSDESSMSLKMKNTKNSVNRMFVHSSKTHSMCILNPSIINVTFYCFSSIIKPEIRQLIIDKIKLELPQNKECWPPFLRLICKITEDFEDFDDAEFLKKMSSSKLLNQLLSFVDTKDKTMDLVKIYTFDILWSLCIFSESENKSACDWKGNYNEKFCQFVLNCFSNERCKSIKRGIAELTQLITDNMDKKWGNKQKKKKNKSTDSVVPNEQDMTEWNQMINALVNRMSSRQLAMDLYLRIFQGERPILRSETIENDDDDYKEEMTETERRKSHKSILPTVSTSNICGLIIDFWLRTEDFETNKLIKISQFVGIDFDQQIVDNLKDLHRAQIAFLNDIISESTVQISCSQWQSLWDFGLKYIANDNEQSKTAITARSKTMEHSEELVVEDRNDEDIVNLLRLTMNDISNKELKITSSQIAEILKLHQRIGNCQHRVMQHQMASIQTMEEFVPLDLLQVDDLNEYQQNVNQIMTNLFKFEVVESSKEHQRSLLNAMYENVIALNKNIKFVEILKKSFDGMMDTEQAFNELLEGWNGSNAMQIGFETAQLILDVMAMGEDYVKLPMNNRKFKEILREYKMTQQKWNEVKDLTDKWNNKMDEEQQIEWGTVDLVSNEVNECLVNIENFLEMQ